MEKDDEINGEGNSYTAEFWQYDPRLGRRWNVDPLTYPWQSSYAAFNNNPIYYIDPLGLEGVDQETANSGGGNVGDTYEDENGSVFEKSDIGWIPQQSGGSTESNPTLHGRIKKNVISGAARGTIKKVEGIVIHRTDSNDPKQTMNGFKSGKGTQFLIDREGNIFQTTNSVTDKTWHVGAIKSRCEATGDCDILKKNSGETWKKYALRQHKIEKKKDYPTRYPYNDTSIGIEFMGKHNGKNGWEPVTEDQIKAGVFLIQLLQNRYNLTNDDIYNHEDISRKTPGEGGDVTKALGINQVFN